MHKIWLVIQREYTTRVKNKRFLLVTFLMPALILGLIFGSAYLSTTGTEHRKIAVIDPNGFVKNSLQNTNQIQFEFPEKVDTTNYNQKGYSDILILPKFETNQKDNKKISSARVAVTKQQRK